MNPKMRDEQLHGNFRTIQIHGKKPKPSTPTPTPKKPKQTNKQTKKAPSNL